MVIIPNSMVMVDGLSFTVGHGGGANPICVDHVFIGYGSNHAGYGFDHSSNGFDHADNSSTTSLLQRKGDRQLRPD
jgi:hypothetical protein